MIDLTTWIMTLGFGLIAAKKWWTLSGRLATAVNVAVLAVGAYLLANIAFDFRLFVPVDPAFRGSIRLARLIVSIAVVAFVFASVIRQIMRDEAARVAAFED